MSRPVKINVLYFHHAIGLGGAPRSLGNLISYLGESVNATVVMPDRPGNDEVKSIFADAGATVIEERHIRPFNGSEVAPCLSIKEKAYATLSFPLLSNTSKRLVGKIKPDIVHLNSTCLVAAARGAKAAKCGAPIIAHVREPILKNKWGGLLASLNRKYVDHFVSIDQYGADSLRIENSKERVTVVRNFVKQDLLQMKEAKQSVIRDSARQQHGWSETDVIILFLARVTTHNGVRELLSLIKQVDEQLENRAKFAFAGFSNSKNNYELKCLDAINDNARCIAIDFTKDPISLILGSDVVIAPFTTPHSARSVFEGAACGRPAIVSRMPNLLELIHEGATGFSFDFETNNNFVAAVNRLCVNDDRAAMGQASKEFAQQNFDPEKNAQATYEVYCQLVKENHAIN